jgi:hypothetical protein
MKKILSLLMIFTLCFILVGCDDEGPIPYKYDSYEASEKISELGSSTGFLLEYSMIGSEDSYRNIKYLYDDFEDWDDDDYDDYDDYEDDDYSSMTITIGIKNGITYISSGFAEIYVDQTDGSRVVLYVGAMDDSGSYRWMKQDMSYTEFYSNDYYSVYSSIYDYLMPTQAFYHGEVMKKKTDVICGRLCDNLTIADSMNQGDSINICIDKEYGFCLKMATVETYRGETYTSGMECTRFEINPGIVLPNV